MQTEQQQSMNANMMTEYQRNYEEALRRQQQEQLQIN